MCDTRKVGLGGRNDRCGYGPRLPLVVISPYTRENYVSHNRTDQSSVIKFIEQNWLRGESVPGGSFDKIAGSLDARGGVLDFRTRPHFAKLILNPITGAVVRA
jgi:phospholipase C